MLCNACGQQVPPDSTFCNRCGKPIPKETPPRQPAPIFYPTVGGEPGRVAGPATRKFILGGPKAWLVAFFVIAVVLTIISVKTKQPSTERSGPAAYTLPPELILGAHAVRGPEGELYIVGSMNFPDGMKMWVNVGAPDVIASDDDVQVYNSKFETRALWQRIPNPFFNSRMAKFPDGAKLKFRRVPLRAGRYEVHFEADFNSGWQRPEVLRTLGGEGAKNLHGKMFRKLNPDVIDSSQALDYSVAIEVPVLTPEAKAISLVKAAVLTVPGLGRSATDVEANIDLDIGDSALLAKTFHGENAKGILPAKGWIARAKDKDNYEVIFDYTDDAAPAQAIWSVELKTGVVRYVNEHAKNLSWTPD
jgi:hypothetical protein